MTEKIALELTKEEFYALDRNIMMVEETESILKKIKEGYKKLDPPKSPVEEAYKKVYGYYPDIGFGTGFSLVYWDVFQKAYEQAQKDYKVGEYQDPEKEPEEPKTLFDVIRNLGYSVDCSWEIVDAIEEFEKQKIKENLKTSLQEMVNGDVRPIDDVIKEAKKEPKKPQTLFDICFDWYNDYDGDHPIGDLVEYIARNWLPDPIPIDSDEYDSWNAGYNSYRQTLIHTLGGDDDPM